MVEWSGSTVDAGDVELRVYAVGKGPVVLLVHGWPDTHHVWTGVAELLSGSYRVVAYDTRGMGESSHPGADAGFELALLARDLRAVIDSVSPNEPVHLVAHDWGSIQAWEAVAEPWATDRIASFTSISGPSLDHVGHWVRRSLLTPTPRGVSALLRQGVSSSYVPVFLSPLTPVLLRRLFGTKRRWVQFLQRTEGLAPSAQHHATTLPNDMVNGLAYYRANGGRVLRPHSRRVQVPVLLLVPDQDRAVRAASYSDASRWVDDLQRMDVPYGHWLMFARPEVVASAVTTFVEAQAPRGHPAGGLAMEQQDQDHRHDGGQDQ